MKELIKIRTDSAGKRSASAKELHNFLESKQQFSTWFKKKVTKYSFEYYKDFVQVEIESTGGRPSVDYAITIDMAKELSMVENNAKGKEARSYFIECERKAIEAQKQIAKPTSAMDMLRLTFQALEEHDQRVSTLENEMKVLKAQNTTRLDNHFTIAGYCSLLGRSINVHQAASLGRKAAALCKKKGMDYGKIKDPRFGSVGNYPIEVLEEVLGEKIAYA